MQPSASRLTFKPVLPSRADSIWPPSVDPAGRRNASAGEYSTPPRTASPRALSVRGRYASAVAGPPDIRYVSCGGRDLAYQVVGSGTAGFVRYIDLAAHLDLMWTDPVWGQQSERFG